MSLSSSTPESVPSSTPADASIPADSSSSLRSQRKPFIAGNWKMNCDHLHAIALVQKLAWALKDAKHDFSAVEVAVFPPFTDLRSVQTLINADKLSLTYGAQDVSEHEKGPYTGEISALFLKALECRYVIIGHSERRLLHGEGPEQVAAKVARVLQHGLIPLICVGETADDLEQHGPHAVPAAQLEKALARVTAASASANSSAPVPEIVVAYEPVWAIGSGTPATPEQAEHVAAALREIVTAQLGVNAGNSTRILYGGSVKSSNIAGFMRQPNIDGALVGGASLDVTEFSRIARYQSHVIV